MKSATAIPRSGSIVTLGEVMALMLAEPGPGLGTATCYELQCAGAEATVAVAMARLGHDAAFVGRLGLDPLGRQLARTLRSHGVDVRHLRHVDAGPTGLLVRDAPLDRSISVQYYRSGSAASTLEPTDLTDEVCAAIAGASLLHVTGITAVLSPSARATVQLAIDVAKGAGVRVSLDPNVRLKLADTAVWRSVIEELAPAADVVLTGADDARVVTHDDPAQWFLDRGARVVVVKDGANGAWETDGSSRTRGAIRPTIAQDPVGAGDAFAGGWLSAWLRGASPEERLREAAAVASLCVGARGDLTGLPDLIQLRQVLGGSDGVDR